MGLGVRVTLNLKQIKDQTRRMKGQNKYAAHLNKLSNPHTLHKLSEKANTIEVQKVSLYLLFPEKLLK